MNRPESSSYIYVDMDKSLTDLIHRMKRGERLALDTEADSLHHYFEKVCLIQMTIDDHHFILDPLVDLDLEPFLDILSRKSLVLHGADYDLRMLRTSFGFRPKKDVFDTMLAAQLLGFEQLGLASLLERYFAVSLSKKGQRSDWSRRPLSQSQLDYAVDDTRYLHSLAKCLEEELEKRGRLGWHRETCERMVDSTGSENTRDPCEVWRIRGAGLLDRPSLVFLREIWLWRENEAQKADRPPFKIMGNSSLMDLAVWAASHPRPSLIHGPKLPRHCKGGRYRALEQAIKKAQTTPKSQWPLLPESTYQREPDAVLKKLVKSLREECSGIADRLGISPSVLAPRAALAAIAQDRSHTVDEIMTSGSLMRWQALLLEPGVRRILKAYEKSGF